MQHLNAAALVSCEVAEKFLVSVQLLASVSRKVLQRNFAHIRSVTTQSQCEHLQNAALKELSKDALFQ